MPAEKTIAEMHCILALPGLCETIHQVTINSHSFRLASFIGKYGGFVHLCHFLHLKLFSAVIQSCGLLPVAKGRTTTIQKVRFIHDCAILLNPLEDFLVLPGILAEHKPQPAAFNKGR
jgi:hypothetical protein